MIFILLSQFILFAIICITFKYRNRIILVLSAICSIIPILGIFVDLGIIIISAYKATDNYILPKTVKIKNNKLNKWLYAGYFEDEKY